LHVKVGTLGHHIKGEVLFINIDAHCRTGSLAGFVKTDTSEGVNWFIETGIGNRKPRYHQTEISGVRYAQGLQIFAGISTYGDRDIVYILLTPPGGHHYLLHD